MCLCRSPTGEGWSGKVGWDCGSLGQASTGLPRRTRILNDFRATSFGGSEEFGANRVGGLLHLITRNNYNTQYSRQWQLSSRKSLETQTLLLVVEGVRGVNSCNIGRESVFGESESLQGAVSQLVLGQLLPIQQKGSFLNGLGVWLASNALDLFVCHSECFDPYFSSWCAYCPWPMFAAFLVSFFLKVMAKSASARWMFSDWGEWAMMSWMSINLIIRYIGNGISMSSGSRDRGLQLFCSFSYYAQQYF